MMKQVQAFLLLFCAASVSTFTPSSSFVFRSRGAVALNLFGNKGEDYDEVVEKLMKAKGFTREQAEKDYNLYLSNPNDYMLDKGYDYYEALGYSNIMEGIMAEAEKSGTADSIREELAEFKRQSQMKAISIIGVFFGAFVYLKTVYDANPDAF
mmetsp:Transcript_17516/g.27283  ORF Transcript_17516/g.27283 Transcript_17516/m.27283 type:complete len:153 (+) Transcript_17516:79-537(+)